MTDRKSMRNSSNTQKKKRTGSRMIRQKVKQKRRRLILRSFAKSMRIIVVWIQIPGIDVDYPVVHGEDNEYYLHHTFQKEANKAGSIFLDYRNRADFTEQRVSIYGHNMKDGSMFSNLKKYQDSVLREESGTAYLYLPEKTLQLEIVACERVSMRDGVYAMEYNMTCEWSEEIILSTCSTSSDTRLILRCKVIKVWNCKQNE